METEELITKIIHCAYSVHKALPPGYYERIYHRALMIELDEQNLKAESEVWFDANYKGKTIGRFRTDIVVEKCVILELKAIENILPLNGVQLVNYLNMTGIDNGLIINFGSPKLQVERKFRLRNTIN